MAALIWTANPGLNKDQVWDIMWNTATQVNTGNVSRIVHAGRAVNQALPPASLTIQSPTQNQVFSAGAAIPARMTVFNGNKGAPVTTGWIVGESVVDTGTNTTIRLPVGTWTIVAVATFADGSRVAAAVTIRVG